MKQRVVVQAIVKSDEKILLLRRAKGRDEIVGKYELPGGTLENDEQPDDALRRHLERDAGLAVKGLQLRDVMSLSNHDEGEVQHVFIVYDVDGVSQDQPLRLGQNYDRYEWKTMSELHRDDLRDSAAYLLEVEKVEQRHDHFEQHYHKNVENITSLSDHVIIYSDGGSRGNPGPSSAAFVIVDGHHTVIGQGGAYLGLTTNNQAEYHGVRLGLERALEMSLRHVECRIDSMLVVNQLRGSYKIKNRELWPINERINELIPRFDSIVFKHIPRELNQMADSLVNKLLDEHKSDAA